MLKPSVIVDTVVSVLQTIPGLVSAMSDPSRIKAFHFMQGLETPALKAINAMLQPSILVMWAGTSGGNFSGYQIFKHHIDVYLRAPNTVAISTAIAYEDLWYLMM